MRIKQMMESSRFYLTDGGLETFMIFDKGFDLPCFSAASLLETAEGRAAMSDYVRRFLAIAEQSGRGFVLDVPTWRAGLAWAEQLEMSDDEVLAVNYRATEATMAQRDKYETKDLPILLNGLIGPSGDAYKPGEVPTGEEAFAIHAPQIQALGKAGVDLVSAMTMTHASEAIGMVRAAKEIDLPIAVSFTLETDGSLPSGQTLAEAIAEVDQDTSGGPIYFMINCAHPDHFTEVLAEGAEWRARIGGLRTNASRLSHAELDEATELDSGDPLELANLHKPLLDLLPNLKLIGGCCGTDCRHVAQFADLSAVSVQHP